MTPIATTETQPPIPVLWTNPMNLKTSSLATRAQVRAAMQSTVSQAWAVLPAELEAIELASDVDCLVLAFYHWTIALELADYPAGGVLVTASLTPSSPLRRALRAVANPGHGAATVIAQRRRGAIDTRSPRLRHSTSPQRCAVPRWQVA